MQNEYIGHLGVLGVNLGFLFGRANVAHVLGVLVQVRLVAQTLGDPVDAVGLVVVVDRVVRVERYRAVVEGLRAFPQILAAQALGDGERGALEQLVHLAHVADARRVFAQELGWARRERAQHSAGSVRNC